MYNIIPGCSPPDQPDVLYGRDCPNTASSCINGNASYSNISEAWNKCRQVQDCGFIMRYSDQNYYLRRMSDPIANGFEGYVFTNSCGIFHKTY